MKKLILYLAPFILTSSLTFGQQNKIDSLKLIIESAIHDTIIVNALIDISDQVYISNPDTNLLICTQVEKIATEQLIDKSLSAIEIRTYKKALATALNNIGLIFKYRGNSHVALSYFHRSLAMREEIDDKIHLGTSLLNLGSIYNDQGNISKALEYLHRSLKIQEELGNKVGIGNSLGWIGKVYDNQKEIPLALEFYHSSLAVRREIGDKKGIATSLNNIGYVHDKQGNLEEGLAFYLKALKIHEEINNKIGISATLNNIGLVYKKLRDLSKSLYYYERSLAIKEEMEDKSGIVYSLVGLGKLKEKEGELKQAKEYALRSFKLAMELGYPRNISFASKFLSNLNKNEGNYQEALEMYELHIIMRDSINNEKTQKATIRQQTKYEFEKAQLVAEQQRNEALRIKNEELERRDNLQYSIIFLAILLVFGLILSLGSIKLSPAVAEGLIFFAFLILFEFLLVLADPYVDRWTGGEPMYKLLLNAILAGLIFPLHAFFERMFKKRLVKKQLL
ncbi:MAG: tetratricopeptide repeat protein [Flavobacteriales bacterium]|nr:tetratricopeptide repeat protein [Flavobacteriales bacterium]